MTDIFSWVNAAPEAVFYQRNDPNDQRLGETVKRTRAEYDDAQVVLIGCPQDEGVKRNKGRRGAAQAPDAIRGMLYKFVAFDDEHPALFDIGNTRIQDNLEATHDLHQRIVAQILADGKRVIALGGGNDLSYPDCSALSQTTNTLMAINLDAHFDVRADTVRNSGTPYRQLLEESAFQPGNFYEVANMPMVNSPSYQRYLLDKGAHIFDLSHVQEKGIVATLDAILRCDAEAIFWGLDMDVVRAADAPGVSAPNALGITGSDFCQAAACAGRDPRSRILEITEVNPAYDIDGRTSRLAAAAIYHFLANITSS